MKVLVTGGAGFIGSHIVDKLIEHQYEVVVVDNLSTGKMENLNAKARLYDMDITSAELGHIFAAENPDYVVHHAAQIDVQKSMQNPEWDANVNVMGTINILSACVKYGVRKIIYASSAAVYGNPLVLPITEEHPKSPLSFYGISKYTPEQYIQMFCSLHDLKYTILRYANVYGPRQSTLGEAGVVCIFINKLLEGSAPMIYGDGEQTRDFIYVNDVAEANVQALMRGDNRIVNIGTGIEVSINSLFFELSDQMGTPKNPVHAFERKGDIRVSYLCNAKAEAELSWSPRYSLTKGLADTVAYYRRQQELVNQSIDIYA